MERTTPRRPATRLLYCHDCKRVRSCKAGDSPDRAGAWVCHHCGDTIRCDECGADWSEDHEATEHAEAG